MSALEDRGRLKALQAWAESLGVSVEEHRTFHVVDLAGRRQTRDLYKLTEVEDALALLTSYKGRQS